MTWAQSVPREANPHHCHYILCFDDFWCGCTQPFPFIERNGVYMCACLHACSVCMATFVHAACPCTWKFMKILCLSLFVLLFSYVFWQTSAQCIPTQAYQSQPQGVQVSRCRMSIDIYWLSLRMPYFSVWVHQFELSTSVRKELGMGMGKGCKQHQDLHLLPVPLTMVLVAEKPRSRSHLCQPVLIGGDTLVYLVSFRKVSGNCEENLSILAWHVNKSKFALTYLQIDW